MSVRVTADDIRRAQAEVGLMDTYRFGVVQSVSPLTVRLDGDTSVDTPCINVVGNLFVGDYVWVQQNGQRYLVIGRKGAPRMPGLWQRVGYSARTASTANATTTYNMTTITIPTAYCVNGRRFRIMAHGHVQGDTLNAYCDIQAKLGVSAAIGGTQIAGTYAHQYIAAGRQIPFSFYAEYVYGTLSESDGLSPYNLVLTGLASSGNSLCVASTTRPTVLSLDVETI